MNRLRSLVTLAIFFHLIGSVFNVLEVVAPISVNDLLYSQQIVTIK